MSGNGNGSAAWFGQLLESPPHWATEPGPTEQIVLSSRVRLARNLSSLPFPGHTSGGQQALVIGRVQRAVAEIEELANAPYVACDELDATDREVLVERRLVSRDLARGSRKRGVVVGPGESMSVMVNEEDHLRLQSLVSGLRIGEALDAISAVDDRLGEILDYAFDDKLGYLTACPTNVGTGLRASVLAHLPALVLTRRAKKVIQGVTAMGMAVRGFYGEGTDIMGNFFQISNQATLGKNENEIASRLDEVMRQIIGYENEAREIMWATARLQVEDKVYRAYGTLAHARAISTEEVLSLASAVRFGIALDLEGLCPASVLNEILIFSQPAHVARRAGRPLDREERRRLRADYIRKRLAEARRELEGGSEGTSPQDPPRGET